MGRAGWRGERKAWGVGLCQGWEIAFLDSEVRFPGWLTRKALRYLFQERSREEREVRLSKQEGARLWVMIIKVVVCDENGQSIWLWMRQHYHHLVREQEERLRKVIEDNLEKARSSSLT